MAARRYVAHFDLNIYRERAILFGDVNMLPIEMRLVQSALQDWIIGIALRRVSRTGSASASCRNIGPPSCALAFDVPNAKILARV